MLLDIHTQVSLRKTEWVKLSFWLVNKAPSLTQLVIIICDCPFYQWRKRLHANNLSQKCMIRTLVLSFNLSIFLLSPAFQPFTTGISQLKRVHFFLMQNYKYLQRNKSVIFCIIKIAMLDSPLLYSAVSEGDRTIISQANSE